MACSCINLTIWRWYLIYTIQPSLYTTSALNLVRDAWLIHPAKNFTSANLYSNSVSSLLSSAHQTPMILSAYLASIRLMIVLFCLSIIVIDPGNSLLLPSVSLPVWVPIPCKKNTHFCSTSYRTIGLDMPQVVPPQLFCRLWMWWLGRYRLHIPLSIERN